MALTDRQKNLIHLLADERLRWGSSSSGRRRIRTSCNRLDRAKTAGQASGGRSGEALLPFGFVSPLLFFLAEVNILKVGIVGISMHSEREAYHVSHCVCR